MTSLQLVRHYAERDNDVQLVIRYVKLHDNVVTQLTRRFVQLAWRVREGWQQQHGLNITVIIIVG